MVTAKMAKHKVPKEPEGSADKPAQPPAVEPVAPGADNPDEITGFKAFKSEAKLLGRIGNLLDMSQPEVLRHFRRQFEDLYLILLTKEQSRMSGGHS